MSNFSDGGAYARFGSARWAERTDLTKAGLFKPDGLAFAYHDQMLARIDTDAPKITIAGSGSGKARDLLVEMLCRPSQDAFAVLDPRGELFSTTMYTLAGQGIRAYPWCPVGTLGIHGLPCNPLDILDPAGPNFHADVQALAESLIPLSGSGNGKYFELTAQNCLSAIMKALAEKYGRASFPRLYHVLNIIQTDPNAWADEIERMSKSRFKDVKRVAAEMIFKQQDAPKEFSGILGEMLANLAWLNDPALLTALEDSGFSLSVLSEDGPAARVHFIVPAEFLSVWAPLIRTMFTTTILYKSRRPWARRTNLLVDESGQLGKFKALLSAYTFGRGAGVSAWCFFQDTGQIMSNFGREALQSFLGSSALRQFFGVRDYETARLISEMIGEATFAYDDAEAQARAREVRQAQAQSVLFGADPMDVAREFGHASRAAKRPSHVRRPLITPSEVLALSEDEQIVFISGRNLPPVKAKKYPYYTRRELAGRYLPNPYHPPLDRVRIQGRLRAKELRVYQRDVPHKYRDFPQYASGTALEIEGHPLV